MSSLSFATKIIRNKLIASTILLSFAKYKNKIIGSLKPILKPFVTQTISGVAILGMLLTGISMNAPVDVKAAPGDTVCTNKVINGAFTTDLVSWTTSPEWIWNNGTAAFVTDNVSDKTISQSIVGYPVISGKTTFKPKYRNSKS